MFSDYHKRHICIGTKLFSWFTSGSFRTTWLRVKKNHRMTSVSITLLHVFYRRHFQSELDFKQEVYILTNQKFIWIQVSLFFLTSSYNILSVTILCILFSIVVVIAFGFVNSNQSSKTKPGKGVCKFTSSYKV